MVINKKDIIDVDVNSRTVIRTCTNVITGEGDVAANIFGVRVFENGDPLNLVGAGFVCFFIRQDGVTLVCSGDVTGNEATVTLPAAAYAITGNFTLSIKVAKTGMEQTMRIIDGTVAETTTGSISDPAASIPSTSDYDARIEAMIEAAEPIEALHISAANITGTRYKIVVTKEE